MTTISVLLSNPLTTVDPRTAASKRRTSARRVHGFGLLLLGRNFRTSPGKVGGHESLGEIVTGEGRSDCRRGRQGVL